MNIGLHTCTASQDALHSEDMVSVCATVCLRHMVAYIIEETYNSEIYQNPKQKFLIGFLP